MLGPAVRHPHPPKGSSLAVLKQTNSKNICAMTSIGSAFVKLPRFASVQRWCGSSAVASGMLNRRQSDHCG
jgi:hypothetical protein